MKKRLLLFLSSALTGSLLLAAPGALKNLKEMKERDVAPSFELSTPAGKRVTLADFRGRVVFLNFWATWCEPCREEMPAMEKLYRDLKNNDFVIVGVNVKDNKRKAQKFVQDLKITFPILLDPEGKVGSLYGAWGLPTTYIINRKGEVIARAFGPSAWDSKESYDYFRSLLQKPS